MEGCLLNRVVNGYGEKNITIVFYPNHGAGFCNNFRAIRSFFLLSALYGYRFRGNSLLYFIFVVLWGDYFSVMDDRLQSLQYFGKECARTSFRQIVRESLNASCYFITHMHDLTNYIYSNANSSIRMRSLFHELPDKRILTKQLSHLLFNLKKPLKEQAQQIGERMNPPLIGLQIRTGGNLASFKDSASYIKMDNLVNVINLINTIITNNKLENGTIFLSTDSAVVQDHLKRVIHKVVTADVYQIGHTARGRTDYNDSFVKRAVIDLFLLSRCDYLIVTKGSSFGDTAVILSSVNTVFQVSCHVCAETVSFEQSINQTVHWCP